MSGRIHAPVWSDIFVRGVLNIYLLDDYFSTSFKSLVSTPFTFKMRVCHKQLSVRS